MIEYSKSPPVDIPLSSIESSINISPRGKGTTMAHVMRIACNPPETYDPILVWSRNQGTSYIVVDGYHRYAAAQLRAAAMIKSQILYGVLTDYDKRHLDQLPQFVIIAAYRENMKHGISLLNHERKNYAARLYLSGVHDIDTLVSESLVSVGQIRGIIEQLNQGNYQFERQSIVQDEPVATVYTLHLFRYIQKYLDTLEQDESDIAVAMVDAILQLSPEKFKRVIHSLEVLTSSLLEMREELDKLESSDHA